MIMVKGSNMATTRILLADDYAQVREMLAALLQQDGYDVVTAGNGVEAMAMAERQAPDIILSDILMPEMDGFEFCRRIKEHPSLHRIPFVFYTATYVDEEDRRLAQAVGASRFIVKPAPPEVLLEELRQVLADYRQQRLEVPQKPLLEDRELLRMHDRVVEHKLYHKIHELEQERDMVAAYEQRMRHVLIAVLVAISRAVGARDAYNEMHQVRVSQLARCIGQEMGLDAEVVDGIRLSGAVHDLGKLHLPAEILNKPSALSDVEYRLVQTHAEVGYNILKDIDFPWPVADVCYQHHERWDGTGYPRGLKGKEICLAARVVAVADVVEAMTHHRPWRPAKTMEEAMQEIEAGRGSRYCPDVVDATLAMIRGNRFHAWDQEP